MGVRLVPVLRHDLAVDDDVELAVGSGGELEVSDMLTGPAESFACHPGSAQRVASVLAIEDFQLQLVIGSQGAPPMTRSTGIIGPAGHPSQPLGDAPERGPLVGSRVYWGNARFSSTASKFPAMPGNPRGIGEVPTAKSGGNPPYGSSFPGCRTNESL